MHPSSLICSLLSTLMLGLSYGAEQLETAFQWRSIDYNWPTESAREDAIRTGEYNYTQVVPMDLDVAPDGRVFLSFMNFRGVPARLGFVTDYENDSGPLIQPYPSWEWADRNSCNSLWDVHRISIDGCNRLWVVDTGIEYRTKRIRKCPQKLMVFDLTTDTLIRKLVFSNHVVKNPITNVRVETYGANCESTTVYLGETDSNALLIWDMKKLVRLESPIFPNASAAANITTGLENDMGAARVPAFDLSPITYPNEPRFMYFQPVDSHGLYFTSTDQLRGSLFEGSVDIYGRQDVLNNLTLGQAFSSGGSLFFGLAYESALACWNRYTDLAPENVETIVQDNTRLQYPNAVKVVSWPILGEEQVWVLANQYPQFVRGELNFLENNYFVLKSSVASLIANTKCEGPFNLPPAYPAKKNGTTQFLRSTKEIHLPQKVGPATVKSFEMTHL